MQHNLQLSKTIPEPQRVRDAGSRSNVRGTSVSLTIVIVTWNCRKFALECLASVQKDLGQNPVEILVIDNASSDGTPDAIVEKFPAVELIRSDTNLGFAKANNLGLQRAHGQYICLLNPDVELVSPCLAPLMQFLEEHKDVGLVGPAMLNAEHRPARSYMRYPSVWNTFCRALALDNLLAHMPGFGGQLMTDFRPDKIADVEVLNGWFWVIRREALTQVGPLDERFFIYGEDIDWCRRFHTADWRVVFFPGVRAVHYGGGCSSNEPIRFSVEMERANLQYWEKYHGPLERAAYVFFCGLHHLIRAAAYTCLAPISSRGTQVHAKVRRSIECIRWLTGVTRHVRSRGSSSA